MAEPMILHGIGVGSGLAAGPAYRSAPPPGLPPQVPVTDPKAEAARAVAAQQVGE